MKLIKQCFPVVGFVFLKKVVQALEIASEILKKIMKAVKKKWKEYFQPCAACSNQWMKSL